MSSVQLVQRQNPFLRNNPFHRPQKFHSQPKHNLVSQFDQFEYCMPFASKNMSISRNKNHLQSSPSLNSLYSKSQSRVQQFQKPQGYYKHQQKDSKITKHSIKMKENPFLRKNLVPASKENVLPQEKPIKSAKLEDKHRNLFGNFPKANQNINQYQEYIVSFKCSPQLSPKKGNCIPFPKKSLEGETDRSWKSPDKSRNKYQSSDLQIKLKSQTMIEAEEVGGGEEIVLERGLGIPFGNTQRREKNLRLNDDDEPKVIKVRGKNFYRALIQFNF